MSFFFDTNVIVGYLFKWDPWHVQAKDIFNKNEESYWSETVKEECWKVLKRLNKEYISFLDNLTDSLINYNKDKLREKDLLNLARNIPVTKNYNKNNVIDKNKIISSIWSSYGWFEEQKEYLINFFEELSLDFNSSQYIRFSQIETILNLSPKTSNYSLNQKV